MDMELSLLARILWRWKWLIIACVLTASTAVWLGLSNSVPVYRTSTVLTFTTPDRPDVEFVDEYEFVDARNEVVLAINNFLVVAQQPAVYELTKEALGLTEAEAEYKIEISSSGDSDYIEMSVEAESALVAANIVNTHAQFAKERFGVLRAQTTDTSKNSFDEQLTGSSADLTEAETAFLLFREENGMTFLETDVKLRENALIDLQSEQSKLIGRDPVGQSPQIVQLETRIAEQRAALEILAQLEPEYRRLESAVETRRAAYQALLEKSSEAESKADIARGANFISVAEPATVPLEPVDRATRLMLLAVIGSLGLGTLLAFMLEYLTGASLAQEYRVAKEVRTILSDEQLIGSHALLKQLQERSSASRDTFDLTTADSRELLLKEREIELQRRQAETN